jgi:hypothetical protein
LAKSTDCWTNEALISPYDLSASDDLDEQITDSVPESLDYSFDNDFLLPEPDECGEIIQESSALEINDEQLEDSVSLHGPEGC